jgi:hypothetical protein
MTLVPGDVCSVTAYSKLVLHYKRKTRFFVVSCLRKAKDTVHMTVLIDDNVKTFVLKKSSNYMIQSDEPSQEWTYANYMYECMS